MVNGFEFQPNNQAPLENVPTIPVEQPQVEMRRVTESPSHKALIEAISSINKSKFKVIDTYTEKGTFGAPYAPAPEGKELIKKRFRNEDEAREYAEFMNRTKGDPNPEVTQFQIRPIEDPLEDLI